MPNQKITVTHVDNGDEQHDNVLRVQWGEFGGAPDAPDGWVNQGYAMVVLDHVPSESKSEHYVMLEPADLDHLIRTLKRVRRKTHDRALAAK